MSLYKQKLNTRTGAFNLVPSNAVISFKPAVASEVNLPTEGNEINDARLTNDTQHLYVWDGTSWIDQGDIVDLTWSAISGKPSSSVVDIDDAVSKRHTQGTDQGLDTGGANAVTAAQTKTAYTHSGVITGNPHQVNKSDIGLSSVDNKSEATIISDVKLDVDVADALSKRHSQNTDTILKKDGSTELINAGILKTDLRTDRWRSLDTNTFLGVGVAGLGSLQIGGINNTAYGYNALRSIQGGEGNTAIGSQAGLANTSGIGNVIIGARALISNTIGNYNVAIGVDTISTFTNSNYNVCIGYEAGKSISVNDSTLIGFRAGTTTSQPLVAIGYFAGYANTGQTSTLVGYRAGQDNRGNSSVLIGYQAGQNNTGAYATLIGYMAGNGNTGANSTFIGANAGKVTTGGYNTGLGHSALEANTTGNLNVAVGQDAMKSETGGLYNIAVGAGAGKTGKIALTGCVLIGYLAGETAIGDVCTYVGHYAGQTNTKDVATIVGGYAGQNNRGTFFCSFGYYAGRNNTGNNTIAIGAYAAENNTGANSICIGYEAGKSNTTASQFIVKQANVNATPLIQGDFSTGSLDVSGEMKIKVYSQDAEPTLSDTNRFAYWVDTNDNYRTYLVFRRNVAGSGLTEQVKVELI